MFTFLTRLWPTQWAMTRGYDPYIIEDDIACWFVASGLYRAEEDGELWLVQFAGDGRYRFWQYADLFMPAAPELCDDLEELAGECQVLAQDCEQVAHRLERHD